MGETTKIAWTGTKNADGSLSPGSTFNPWVGCTRVSEGCRNCYAEAQDHRWGHDRWGPGKARERTSEANWRKPLAWDRAAAKAGTRPKVFCASLADVFDTEVPADWRADLWRLIASTPNLDWLLLTKRPENLRPMVPWGADGLSIDIRTPDAWPNVWLGTTVEDQAAYHKRLEPLLRVPAAVRFLSIEPQLGPIDLALSGTVPKEWGLGYRAIHELLDWVITGGESGTNARPYDVAWGRSIVRQCREAGVAPFVKQMGARPVDSLAGASLKFPWPTSTGTRANDPMGILLKDRAGSDPAEWPEDIRIRDFPRAESAPAEERSWR